MKYTLCDSQLKQVNIGTILYFIDEGYYKDESCITITESEIIGKVAYNDTHTKYFLRFVFLSGQKTIMDMKVYELTGQDLKESYFKTKMDAINSIRDALQKDQRVINNKFDKLNEMALAINPLTYTSKSEASNSPPAKYQYNKRDGSVD